MISLKRKYQIFQLKSPAELFGLQEEEIFLKECVSGIYTGNIPIGKCYRDYLKHLVEHGFILRCAFQCASVWRRKGFTLIVEHNEECLEVSFLASPAQGKIYLESRAEDVIRNDFKRNALWMQLNHKKPYFCPLWYYAADFSRQRIKRLIVRFADFNSCNFQNSDWRSVRLGIGIEGGRTFCVFKNCDFSGSSFFGVDFSRAKFENCNFSGCVFRNCNFTYMHMKNCVFEDFELLGHNKDEKLIFAS